MAGEPRRIIHVKGVGHASQAPDQVTISITLEAQDKEYSQAVGLIADKIDTLRKSVAAAGFDWEELKTENLYVEPEFDYEKETYNKIFKGYVAEHRVEWTFDLVTEKFNRAIVSLSDCPANPKIKVSFQLKDYTDLLTRLWESVAKNARHKAETLCTASGARLGKLLNIGFKPDDYSVMNDYTSLAGVIAGGKGLDARIFVPADIEIEDSVDFYWEIED